MAFRIEIAKKILGETLDETDFLEERHKNHTKDGVTRTRSTGMLFESKKLAQHVSIVLLYVCVCLYVRFREKE